MFAVPLASVRIFRDWSAAAGNELFFARLVLSTASPTSLANWLLMKLRSSSCCVGCAFPVSALTRVTCRFSTAIVPPAASTLYTGTVADWSRLLRLRVTWSTASAIVFALLSVCSIAPFSTGSASCASACCKLCCTAAETASLPMSLTPERSASRVFTWVIGLKLGAICARAPRPARPPNSPAAARASTTMIVTRTRFDVSISTLNLPSSPAHCALAGQCPDRAFICPHPSKRADLAEVQHRHGRRGSLQRYCDGGRRRHSAR